MTEMLWGAPLYTWMMSAVGLILLAGMLMRKPRGYHAGDTPPEDAGPPPAGPMAGFHTRSAGDDATNAGRTR